MIAWRNSEAAQAGVPVYTIIQQKAILGIVNLLPVDVPSLVRIPYFGKKGAEKYGDVLLNMVNNYVKENNVERPEMPEPSKKKIKEEIVTTKPDATVIVKTPKQDTKEVSFSMFRQGMNIEEIAKARELVTGTIAGHLEHYVRSGVIRINDLVPQEKVDKITQYLQQHADAPSITLIKAGLGDDVSYADIRLVMASLH